MTTLNIRGARREDADAIVALVNKVADEDRSLGVDRFPLTVEAQAQFSAAADPLVHLLLAATVDEDLAGYLYASRGTSDALAHVSSMAIAVDRDARGKGVGKALVQAMRNWAQVVGVRKLTLSVLETNVSARAFFERSGYEVEGVRKGQFHVGGQDVDELLMAAWLGQGGANHV